MEFDYLMLLQKVLHNGHRHENRTGMPTLSLFGAMIQGEVGEAFPLLTTKRVNYKAVVAELLWFISGSTNIHSLDSKIWDEWADADGNLGPVYGKQWNDFGGVNQLHEVQRQLREDPMSRRIICSAWNPPEIPDMALPPCHILWQLKVDKGLHMCVYQRSADMFLGVPFNIASYATLLHLLAATHGLVPRTLTMFFGDCHIYDNHREQVKEQISRPMLHAPTLNITAQPTLHSYRAEDIVLEGYEPHPAIKGEVSC
jgi:thymidylate synthase